MDLPTKPSLSINPVIGTPGSASTAMKRWDHAPFHSVSDKFIEFYVKNDYSDNANASVKNWLAKNRETNESLAPPLLYTKYEFEYLGMENAEEAQTTGGTGTSATTNMKSGGWWWNCKQGAAVVKRSVKHVTGSEAGIIENTGSFGVNGTAYGNIGFGSQGTKYDYREFVICLPYIKHPGSHAFTVNLWNGISE